MTRFWKYQGLGNDFILVDWRGRANIPGELTRAVCDRHFGIGGDGILAWLDGPDGAPFMRVFNTDGSIADMCGNGLRCFARWLVEEQGLSPESRVIGSDAGGQETLTHMTDGRVTAIAVNLGPARHAGPAQVTVEDRVFAGHDLFLGNPHFVIPRAPDGFEPGTHGPGLSVHAHFPRDTNVEWLEILSSREARVTVYERGCGLTRACGTGGAGAVAVGVLLGQLDIAADLLVHQPGGDLMYRVDAQSRDVWMTGPAEPVFVGETALLDAAP
jgi:diaminopimelate epimerase